MGGKKRSSPARGRGGKKSQFEGLDLARLSVLPALLAVFATVQEATARIVARQRLDGAPLFRRHSAEEAGLVPLVRLMQIATCTQVAVAEPTRVVVEPVVVVPPKILDFGAVEVAQQ